jgi:mono/diheme cytochrome c family protein
MKFRNVLLLGIAIFALSACSFSLAEDITPPADYQSPTPGATDSPLFPQAMPDVANGQVIFAEKCAPCHGSSGQGDGPMAAQLQKPPAALANLELGRKSALVNWYTTVTDGNINSFMPPFKDGLNDQERWDVVAYALSLGGYSSNEAMVGKGIYESACVQCHGQTGNLVPSAKLLCPSLAKMISPILLSMALVRCPVLETPFLKTSYSRSLLMFGRSHFRFRKEIAPPPPRLPKWSLPQPLRL